MSNTCVIGWPISHSRSPIIHNYWRRQHNIQGTYEKCVVAPDQLTNFIANLATSKYIGCNVTIPHKEAVIGLVKHLDPNALTLGAANTVYLRNGEVHATSTDGFGFVENLKHHAPSFKISNSNVVLLGAGGSAKSIIGALLQQGAKTISVINRSPAKIDNLFLQFGPKIFICNETNKTDSLSGCDLIVNTTSLGMAGQPPLTIFLDALHPKAVVADIVYAPLVTEFLQRAERRGHCIVPGLGMLLHQAVGGFELWHGVKPEVTAELFALVEADLLQPIMS